MAARRQQRRHSDLFKLFRKTSINAGRFNERNHLDLVEQYNARVDFVALDLAGISPAENCSWADAEAFGDGASFAEFSPPTPSRCESCAMNEFFIVVMAAFSREPQPGNNSAAIP